MNRTGSQKPEVVFTSSEAVMTQDGTPSVIPRHHKFALTSVSNQNLVVFSQPHGSGQCYGVAISGQESFSLFFSLSFSVSLSVFFSLLLPICVFCLCVCMWVGGWGCMCATWERGGDTEIQKLILGGKHLLLVPGMEPTSC